jgi:hypothetical protein
MSFLDSREQLSPQGIGKSVPRREDARLLMGRGRYANDFSLPGQAYAYILRSPHAHARIAGIDVSAPRSTTLSSVSPARRRTEICRGAQKVGSILTPASSTWISTASTPLLHLSVGVFAGAVEDHQLAAAMCRAYSRWLADYCRPYPDRPIRCRHAADAVRRPRRRRDALRTAEARHAWRIPPAHPYKDRRLHDPSYEPFWTTAAELDFSIGFHEGSNAGAGPVSFGEVASERCRQRHGRLDTRGPICGP